MSGINIIVRNVTIGNSIIIILCTEEPWIVLEYLPHGDLKIFLTVSAIIVKQWRGKHGCSGCWSTHIFSG